MAAAVPVGEPQETPAPKAFYNSGIDLSLYALVPPFGTICLSCELL